MNKSIEKIFKVSSSGLLLEGLYYIPSSGAQEEDIQKTEYSFPFKISKEYKAFLKHWNGINLDIIRFYGCGKTEDSLPEIIYSKDINLIIIGSDPAGFLYGQDSNGTIFSIDSDGGEIKKISASFDEFVTDYLFGKRAIEFGGEDWVNELTHAHII